MRMVDLGVLKRFCNGIRLEWFHKETINKHVVANLNGEPSTSHLVSM